jgi:hypothetical protein
LGFVLSQPVKSDPSLRGTFTDSTKFYRFIPELTHRHDDGLVSHLWLGLGKDYFNINTSALYLDTTSLVVSGRYELEHPISDSWKAYYGIEDTTQWANVGFQLPKTFASGGVANPISGGQTINESSNYDTTTLGLYWRNTIHLSDSPWTFLPGVRLDYFNKTGEAIPQPRAAVRYAVDPTLTLRAATGLYIQAPQPQELDPQYGNPGLKSERAWHLTTGFEKLFHERGAEGWDLSTDVFYKHLDNLVIPSTLLNAGGQPQFYNNNGTGDIYGLEFLTKYNSNRWSGWLAYTLSRSTRISPPALQALFGYDQTHSLTAIASFELGDNWKISGRIRYTTGDPYTDITNAVLDVDNDVYIPIRGPLYTDRLDPFFEADVRVDKKWVHDTWIFSAYLDIENITNRQNAQQISYSYNFSQTAVISGPPILPTIGVKGEF